VFRASCERSLSVLRTNKEALLTVLEVMLHDPLYNWSVGPGKAAAKQAGEWKKLAAEEAAAGQKAKGNRSAHFWLSSTYFLDHLSFAVFRVRIRIGSAFDGRLDPYFECGSGSRRPKTFGCAFIICGCYVLIQSSYGSFKKFCSSF
jgi:hypothetical protein